MEDAARLVYSLDMLKIDSQRYICRKLHYGFGNVDSILHLTDIYTDGI